MKLVEEDNNGLIPVLYVMDLITEFIFKREQFHIDEMVNCYFDNNIAYGEYEVYKSENDNEHLGTMVCTIDSNLKIVYTLNGIEQNIESILPKLNKYLRSIFQF